MILRVSVVMIGSRKTKVLKYFLRLVHIREITSKKEKMLKVHFSNLVCTKGELNKSPKTTILSAISIKYYNPEKQSQQ